MSNDLSFEVVRASTEELIDQCKTIRITVFVDEQKFPLECVVDSYDSDPSTIHFLLRVSTTLEPIGTLRLCPSFSSSFSSSPSQTPDYSYEYKMERVCVLEPYRKNKLGARLIRAAHAHLKESLSASLPNSEGVPRACVALHSQIPAMGFYAKCGYEAYEDESDEHGLPHTHKAMRIVLAIPNH